MKKLILLVLLSGALVVTPGCSTSQTKTAYRAEVASVVTVETAVAVYRAAVKQGLLSSEQRAKAQLAFDKWKAAELLAIDTTRALDGSASSQAAFTAASLALQDLVSLLTSFGLKVK